MKKINNVLITTSGLGKRLKELTAFTNKTLLPVGGKPIISHIIENYPKSTNFVITLGHYGRHIREFLELAYPSYFFKFIEIDNYSRKGSSLGYSMLQAAKYLQCPFIFHASDTIVSHSFGNLKFNWIAGLPIKYSSDYRTFEVSDNNVNFINEKDESTFKYTHIGLVGIYEYNKFWKKLEELYRANPKLSSLSDAHCVNEMIKTGSKIHVLPTKSWFDTGNLKSLEATRKYFPNPHTYLEKHNEFIYFLEKMVIKFFQDKKKVKNRVLRARLLKGIVPDILGNTENYFKYRFVKGVTFSSIINQDNLTLFLHWMEKKVWEKSTVVESEKFKKICYQFYFTKTVKRADEFFKRYSMKDEISIINGEKVPPLREILNQMDFTWLSKGKQCRIHGDLILENIIYDSKKFILLDWREDFGGLLQSGDIYYDLAKLNHSMIINHKIVEKNLFSIIECDNSIQCEILKFKNLQQCQRELFRYITNCNLDVQKVKIITGLIWVNMSSLHNYSFDKFLFYFGKLALWKSIYETQKP